MMDIVDVDGIAAEVAREKLGKEYFVRAFHDDSVASDGSGAISITLVIEPRAVDELSGDMVVDTLVGIRQRLSEAGEERLPMVSYATEDELTNADSES